MSPGYRNDFIVSGFFVGWGRESGDMQKLPTASTLDSSSQVSFLSIPNSMFLLSNSIQHTQATYIVQSTRYSEIVNILVAIICHGRLIIHTYHNNKTCTYLYYTWKPHHTWKWDIRTSNNHCARKPNNCCNKLSKL